MKYKLIKEYPNVKGYLSEGDIVEKRHYRLFTSYTKDGVISLDPKHVEGHPEFWKKVDESLFTTDDGVDIYSDDEYYIVNIDKNKIFKSKGKETHKGVGFNEHIKRFASKKNATEYLERHKPRYSTADIQRAYDELDDGNILKYSGKLLNDFLHNLRQ